MKIILSLLILVSISSAWNKVYLNEARNVIIVICTKYIIKDGIIIIEGKDVIFSKSIWYERNTYTLDRYKDVLTFKSSSFTVQVYKNKIQIKEGK